MCGETRVFFQAQPLGNESINTPAKIRIKKSAVLKMEKRIMRLL